MIAEDVSYLILGCLNEAIKDSEVAKFVRETPNFHEPCEMRSEDFFFPLHSEVFPKEELSEFCFVSSNLISQLSFENGINLINVYSSFVYLYSYSFVGEGLVMVSLAVRICLKFSSLEFLPNLSHYFVGLFEFCLERGDSFDNEAAFFLKAGILFLQDHRKFRNYIDANRGCVQNTDSFECPEAWMTLADLK